MKDKKVCCDQCGKEIDLVYYYISDNAAAMETVNNIFCSERCILDYLGVDSDILR